MNSERYERKRLRDVSLHSSGVSQASMQIPSKLSQSADRDIKVSPAEHKARIYEGRTESHEQQFFVK